MAFSLIQIFYWLALASWFGGALFIAVAAPIIFRTVQESDPTLPMVLSVNLEGQHATLLAGSIVANLLGTLRNIELFCAAVLALCFVSHWYFLFHLQLPQLILRSALFAASALLLFYDWRVISPRISKLRQQYIDHADEPEIANPAREGFDRYHRESVTILMFELFALLGLVLFSAGISTVQTFSL